MMQRARWRMLFAKLHLQLSDNAEHPEGALQGVSQMLHVEGMPNAILPSLLVQIANVRQRI